MQADANRTAIYLTRFIAKPLAIAVFFVLLALLWTFPLQHVVAYPFVFLFFGAVMCSAWFGGFIAGILAVVLSALLIDFFSLPPLYSINVSEGFRSYETAFIVCAIAITAVSAARRRSEAAVRSARDELDRRVQERTEELQRSILEKEQATQELNLAQERLSDLARTLSMAEMAAAIAHQLNQPLTALTTEAHACRRWLQSQPPNVDRATMTAERMVRETARASAVVDRVRSLFSRSDYRREATDLNRLIGDLARVLRDEANRHKVSIQLQLSDGIPLVMVDPVQIQQVILNLVMNAMEAIGENAAVRNVEISTELAGDEVRVSVQDHGGGIPETVKDRIFEPFFTTKEKGTGMGLAICRTIMEEHDGRIWAESLESGTAIRFALKVKQA